MKLLAEIAPGACAARNCTAAAPRRSRPPFAWPSRSPEARDPWLLGRLPRPRPAGHGPDRRPVKQNWAAGDRHALTPYADCYPLPVQAAAPRLRHGLPRSSPRKQIKVATGGQLAAVLIEPIRGRPATSCGRREFLPACRRIAAGEEALLICRRNDHRLRPHRQDVRLRTHRHQPDAMTVARASATASRGRA